MAELEGVTVGIHPETTETEGPKVEGTKTTTKKMKGPPEILYSINSKYGKIPVYKTEEEPCKLKGDETLEQLLPKHLEMMWPRFDEHGVMVYIKYGIMKQVKCLLFGHCSECGQERKVLAC